LYGELSASIPSVLAPTLPVSDYPVFSLIFSLAAFLCSFISVPFPQRRGSRELFAPLPDGPPGAAAVLLVFLAYGTQGADQTTMPALLDTFRLRGESTAEKAVMLAVSTFVMLTTTGSVYGWSPILLILQELGVYSELCTGDDTPQPGDGDITTVRHII
jgi:hypothetical protein